MDAAEQGLLCPCWCLWLGRGGGDRLPHSPWPTTEPSSSSVIIPPPPTWHKWDDHSEAVGTESTQSGRHLSGLFIVQRSKCQGQNIPSPHTSARPTRRRRRSSRAGEGSVGAVVSGQAVLRSSWKSVTRGVEGPLWQPGLALEGWGVLGPLGEGGPALALLQADCCPVQPSHSQPPCLVRRQRGPVPGTLSPLPSLQFQSPFGFGRGDMSPADPLESAAPWSPWLGSREVGLPRRVVRGREEPVQEAPPHLSSPSRWPRGWRQQ